MLRGAWLCLLGLLAREVIVALDAMDLRTTVVRTLCTMPPTNLLRRERFDGAELRFRGRVAFASAAAPSVSSSELLSFVLRWCTLHSAPLSRSRRICALVLRDERLERAEKEAEAEHSIAA